MYIIEYAVFDWAPVHDDNDIEDNDDKDFDDNKNDDDTGWQAAGRIGRVIVYPQHLHPPGPLHFNGHPPT